MEYTHKIKSCCWIAVLQTWITFQVIQYLVQSSLVAYVIAYFSIMYRDLLFYQSVKEGWSNILFMTKSSWKNMMVGVDVSCLGNLTTNLILKMTSTKNKMILPLNWELAEHPLFWRGPLSKSLKSCLQFLSLGPLGGILNMLLDKKQNNVIS